MSKTVSAASVTLPQGIGRSLALIGARYVLPGTLLTLAAQSMIVLPSWLAVLAPALHLQVAS